MNAKYLGDYKGKKVFRFPVKVTCGEIAALTQQNIYPEVVFPVVAHSAREARDFIADRLMHVPCVEVEVFGPKGGLAAHSYWGWDRAIFFQMIKDQDRRKSEAKQLRFILDPPAQEQAVAA